MPTRLPPLNALRAFEAAARHLSFTKAAAELLVTQAAISHQIKALEDHLGCRLFRRIGRTLLLTDEGQALLPHVHGAFEELAAGLRRLEHCRAAGVLTLSVMPSLAATWLVPRLRDFRARHPEIELHLSATDLLVDFERDPIDAAIRYGLGSWPGVRAERLFAAPLIPVCSPALLTGPPPLQIPADLAAHTLLHAVNSLDEWRMWLLGAGASTIEPERGLRFATSALALQAAVAGMGVAIGRPPLIAEDLAAGRLVAPFAFELPSDCGYYLATPAARQDPPKVQALRRWLLAAAAAEVLPGLTSIKAAGAPTAEPAPSAQPGSQPTP
jgi:LysR family glycine cleavage system transcriptional activator